MNTHHRRAAAIVRSILAGQWTDSLPEWANDGLGTYVGESPSQFLRAVQTAEAFLIFFGPDADTEREFLIACGLVEE